MFKKRKELKSIIEKDIYRYYGINKIPFIEKVFPFNMGLKYIILFRKASFYQNSNKIISYYYKYKLKKLSIKLGFQIPPATQIGYGFYLGHIGSTVVNPESVLGNNVNLAQGVTIGAHIRGKYKGCPTIGNMVAVGANAVIVGKINIGDNVFIAPNAFVSKDVPSNSIVIGNPATVIPNENAVYGFFTYPIKVEDYYVKK